MSKIRTCAPPSLDENVSIKEGDNVYLVKDLNAHGVVIGIEDGCTHKKMFAVTLHKRSGYYYYFEEELKKIG